MAKSGGNGNGEAAEKARRNEAMKKGNRNQAAKSMAA
jgi:hypothetical protein